MLLESGRAFTMRHPWKSAGLIVGLCMVACGTDPAAQVTIRFDWADAPPAPSSEYMVEVAVESANGQRTPASPIRYRPGVAIELDRVPFGSGLVVDVRFRETEPPQTVRYFGRSTPFDLFEATTVDVPVDIHLTDAPQLAGAASMGLQIRNVIDGRVAEAVLDLEVRGRGIDTLEVAQDFLFEQGRVEYAADETRFGDPDPDGMITHRLAYDLNAARAECQGAGNDPSGCEGERQIFVRGHRRYLTSLTETLRLILDTRPPGIARASVSYTAELDNPLPQVSEAKDGTVVVVTIVLDEAIDVENPPPRLEASSGDVVLDFELVEPDGTLTNSVSFMAQVDAGRHPDGTYVPRLAMRDLVGNRNPAASFTEPPIEIDTSKDVLVVAQDEVSYIRSPVGRVEAETLVDGEGEPGFTIPAGPAYFALGPSDGLDPSPVLPPSAFFFENGDPPSMIRIWGDAGGQDLLQSAEPTGDGRWHRDRLRLPNIDRPRIYVTGLDAAGNESAPVPIQNAWYVATSASGRDGRTPHLLATAGEPAPPMGRLSLLTNRTGLGAPGGRVLEQTAEVRWRERAVQEGPPPTFYTRMSPDLARGRMVVIGGDGLSDPWERGDARWVQVEPQSEQPARVTGHALAYDAARGRTVIFGGFGSGGLEIGETWEWDGARWTEIPPSTPGPPARAQHNMVYDSRRARVVMFGGNFQAQEPWFTDTWEWDGRAWHDVTPPGPSPTGRTWPALAYDAARGRVVLFGGYNEQDGILDDHWEWDGEAWTPITTTSTAPGARWGAGLSYDPERQHVVLYGGGREVEEIVNWADTWEWDGTSWTRREIVGPPARVNHATAFDPDLEGIILYGGSINRSNQSFGDRWLWDGSTWTQLDLVEREVPSARTAPALVFDPAREQPVMFGGNSQLVGGVGDAPIYDAWAWTSTVWRKLDTPNAPPARAHSIILVDRGREEVVMFGGITEQDELLNDTWVWDGAEWTERTPATRPPVLAYAAAAYDEARGHVVMFGGLREQSVLSEETWVWNGTTWSEESRSGPGPRTNHAMAYDASNQRVVMFGGLAAGRLGDLWEWDGQTWRQRLVSGPQPNPRSLHSMTYDPSRQQILLFGGFDPFNVLFDLWAWDGNAWTELTPAQGNPPPRGQTAFVHDPLRGTSLFFGGVPFSELLGDTWELLPPDRPVIQFAPRLPSDLSREQLQDVRVRAHCAGAFTRDGDVHEGAELAVWKVIGERVGWQVVDDNDARVPSEDVVLGFELRGEPEEEVQSTFVSREERLFWQCRPKGQSDPAGPPATVALDYIEVRVKYAVP